jgi:hypothetical protein
MSSVVGSSAAPVETIENLYEVRRPEVIRLFLGAHPFLLPLLEEAHGKIQERFPASRVYLQVLNDPEDPANSQLIAFVATECNPADAFKKLQELDTDWWLAAMDRAKGKFHINLEPA